MNRIINLINLDFLKEILKGILIWESTENSRKRLIIMISIFLNLRKPKEISAENSNQNLHKHNLRFSWQFSVENSRQNLHKNNLRFSWEISIENSSEFLFGDFNENVKRFLVENSLRDLHRRIWHGKQDKAEDLVELLQKMLLNFIQILSKSKKFVHFSQYW